MKALFVVFLLITWVNAQAKRNDRETQKFLLCRQQCHFSCHIEMNHRRQYKSDNFLRQCLGKCESNCNNENENENQDGTCMNGNKLVIISLDGFSHNYLLPNYFQGNTSANLSNLHKYFIDNGATINDLIPIYPTSTYPSHYTIVTGMYPKDHAIVGNVFYDPILKETWDIRTHKEDETGLWYKGEPIWNTAKIKGINTCAFYFPGTMANCSARNEKYIGWPDYYETPYVYNWQFKDQMDKALNLLNNSNKSQETEYGLVMLYMYQPDYYGHVYGPTSLQVKQTIETLDQEIGYFMKNLEKMNLIDKTDVIILSDHGMTELEKASNVYNVNVYDNDTMFELTVNQSIENRQILIDTFIFDLIQIEYVVIDSVMIFIYIDESIDASRLPDLLTTINNEAILTNTDHVHVYRNGQIPFNYNYGFDDRIPDILILADIGYTFLLEWNEVIYQNNILGNHGYDGNEQDMHGIFMASGPSFKSNYQSDTSVETVDLYSLFCHLLCNVQPNPASRSSFDKISNVLKNG